MTTVEESRILVIEDEPKVLEVIVDLLQHAGYSTQATTDSREAVRLLETTAFDVVVSDIMMPYLNGLQVLELAKRQSPDAQVVLVTAYSTREIAAEALNKGASGFVEKPFQTEQLLRAVREALRRRRLKQTSTGSG
jgi:CheY-like chemotaxis protein